MAQIPFQNFAFTDPVAAQQAVQMGQLLTLAQAEKDRNMAQFAQETLRQRTAQQNAARQQAMTQAQMQQQMAEAEMNRRARADETGKILASQEKVAGLNLEGKKTYQADNEKFDSLASLIESEDPPTDSEFEALAAGLSPDRKLPLKNALMQKRRALLSLATEAQDLADFWNGEMAKVKVGDDAGLKSTRERFAKDRRAGELLKIDPSTNKLVPKYRGPRIDTPPLSTNTGGIMSIDELRSRIAAPGVRDINAIEPGGIMVPRLPAGVVNDMAIPVAPVQTPQIAVPRMIPLGY